MRTVEAHLNWTKNISQSRCPLFIFEDFPHLQLDLVTVRDVSIGMAISSFGSEMNLPPRVGLVTVLDTLDPVLHLESNLTRLFILLQTAVH